ncbi:SPASM domain-containing protein [bacterium]|nr:MAG: SPASM domain-containing protein [bacterium]
MNDPVCDLPWRIHWRLLGRDPEPYLDAVKECQPLSMLVEVNEPGDLSPLGFPWPNTAVVVVLREWKAVSGVLPSDGIARWEFPVMGPAEAEEIAGRFFPDMLPSLVSFRWLPVKGALNDLPRMLETAIGKGCGLTLPNRPADDITAEEEDLLPGMEELTESSLTRMKKAAAQLGHDRLKVHDFILSAAMELAGPEPLGCEAGNSIAFLDREGEVYPCSSLLVKMGDLSSESFASIWAKPIRSRIRKDVCALPSVCAGCPVLDRCRGGCRGIVYHLKGHFGAPDLLCSVGKEDQTRGHADTEMR